MGSGSAWGEATGEAEQQLRREKGGASLGVEFSAQGPRGDAIGLLQERHRQRSAANYALLAAIRRCDELEVWVADGCRDMAEWVAGQCDVSCWVARRWIKAAHALVQLPLLSQALDSGELSLEKAVELACFATPQEEKKLIAWARKVSLSAVRRKAEVVAAEAKEEVKEDEHQRHARYWWVDNGRYLWLQALLPAEQGAVVAQALDRLADHVPEIVADDHDDSLNLISHDDAAEKRAADALYLMASHQIASDADPDRATVVVHVDYPVLTGGPGEAYIENGPQIRSETAALMACDARVQVVVEKDGLPVKIGRTSRIVPAYMKRQLRHRDRKCSFPGCEMTGFLHAHHVKAWSEDGGPTDPDNLTLVCPFHHKLLHERGWSVVLDAHGQATWYRPDGSAYEPRVETPSLLDLEDATPVTAGPVAGRQPIGAGVF